MPDLYKYGVKFSTTPLLAICVKADNHRLLHERRSVDRRGPPISLQRTELKPVIRRHHHRGALPAAAQQRPALDAEQAAARYGLGGEPVPLVLVEERLGRAA